LLASACLPACLQLARDLQTFRAELQQQRTQTLGGGSTEPFSEEAAVLVAALDG
jgi:hypothetical protein